MGMRLKTQPWAVANEREDQKQASAVGKEGQSRRERKHKGRSKEGGQQLKGTSQGLTQRRQGRKGGVAHREPRQQEPRLKRH